MNQKHLVKCLLSLSLIGITAGCGNSEVVKSTSTQIKETKELQQPASSESTIKNPESSSGTKPKSDSAKPTPQQSTPSKDKIETNNWVFADTRSHPFEGELQSYELKDGQLISIDFKANTAIIIPTNPTDIISIGSRMGKVSNYLVRNDKEQSSKLTPVEIAHLENGGEFLVVIDDWRDGEDQSIQATQVQSIFYKKDGKYYSIKDNKLFDACSNSDGNECKRISS